MAKSRKNNRFSNQNRRSKCRKHNIQRGGEITYVKALVTFADSPRFGNISKDDIILQTIKDNDWAIGYNVTQGCAPVQYPINDTYIQPYTPEKMEQENGNTCLKGEQAQSSRGERVQSSRGERVQSSRGERVQNYSINKGFCGRKGPLGGRDNCVVLTSTSTKNKVVLYVHPKDTINVRYFKTHDDITYTDADQKVLTNEIIREIITKLNIEGLVSDVNTSLQTYISEHKTEIYKGKNMLSILSNLSKLSNL